MMLATSPIAGASSRRPPSRRIRALAWLGLAWLSQDLAACGDRTLDEQQRTDGVNPAAADTSQLPTQNSANGVVTAPSGNIMDACPDYCRHPCAGCTLTCQYWVGTFACCDGDQCGVADCSETCNAPAFEDLDWVGAWHSFGTCDAACGVTLNRAAGASRVELTVEGEYSITDILSSRPVLHSNAGNLTAAGLAAIQTALASVGRSDIDGTHCGSACDTLSWRVLDMTVSGARTWVSYQVAPRVLIELDAFVSSVELALVTCQSSHYVVPDADCIAYVE